MFSGLKRCAVVVLLACAVVPGCNVIQSLLGQGVKETGKSELKRFASEGELLNYFKGQINARNSSIGTFDRGMMGGGNGMTPQAPTSQGGAGGADSSASNGAAPPMLSPAPGESGVTSGGGFSGTTTQEVGVDEADVVKTDGNNLYVISGKNADSILRIVGIGASGQTQLLSETPLTGYGRDLYLHNNKVVALTSGGGFAFPMLLGGVAVAQSDAGSGTAGATDAGSAGGTGTTDPGSAPSSGTAGAPVDGTGGTGSSGTVDAQPINGISFMPPIDQFVYERPYTLVTIVDASNPSSTSVLSTTKIDGSVSSSRMIDGVLHLVMANYENNFYDVMPRLGMPTLDLSTVDTASLLPKYSQTIAGGAETTGNVVAWENLYRPTDPDGFGVVTVVSLDVDNDAQFTAVGIVAEPGLIYSSLEALYLTDTNYDWQGNARTTTDIYKFSYDGRGAKAVATGTVPGRILNQYSMGEYNSNLRVATTIDATFDFNWMMGVAGTATQSQNGVYVLSQSDTALAVVGRAENIASGETIQSARFLGDKGFLVTFKQMDPLFTMDLSDPANPRVVGKLEVPGYSTFLTPIDENHILAVGQYIPPDNTIGNWGVQLSIFDVTDFAKPLQTSNVIIGADAKTSAYSEALWDPKAFTYFSEGGVVALPMSIYEYVPFGGGMMGGMGVNPVPAPTDSTSGNTGGGTSGSGSAAAGTTTGDAGAPPPDSTTTDGSTGAADPAQPQGFDGIYLYRVSAADGLTKLGQISTRFDEAKDYWGASFTRGVFVGGDVYAVTDLGVHSASMSDLSTEQSKLFFGLPYDPSPIPVEPPVKPGDGATATPGGTSSSDGSATTGSGGTGQGTAGATVTP